MCSSRRQLNRVYSKPLPCLTPVLISKLFRKSHPNLTLNVVLVRIVFERFMVFLSTLNSASAWKECLST